MELPVGVDCGRLWEAAQGGVGCSAEAVEMVWARCGNVPRKPRLGQVASATMLCVKYKAMGRAPAHH